MFPAFDEAWIQHLFVFREHFVEPRATQLRTREAAHDVCGAVQGSALTDWTATCASAGCPGESTANSPGGQ